jgi:hypothetical protein
MPAAAFVVLPMAIVTWLVTSVALWLLRRRPRPRAWLETNRWWFLWPILAIYLGSIAHWLVGLVLAFAGVCAYAVVHRTATAT